MNKTNYTGYSEKAREFLKKNNVKVGDRVRVKGDLVHTGVLMARFEQNEDDHIVIKLKNGYNIGLDISEIESLEIIEEKRTGIVPDIKKKMDSKLEKILIISTGGTIASRIDYRTGAVTPTLDISELIAQIPELEKIANIDYKVLMTKYSENIVPKDWLVIAKEIDKHASSDYAGIIVAHGTDTMQYTSAFLSFALKGYPIPIVLVGSQRSSDRPSSDAALNLIIAAKFVTNSKVQGVFVAMHQNENDDVIAFHLGTRVRKNHTSKRGAFQTVGNDPAFLINHEETKSNYQTELIKYTPKIALSTKVFFVKYHPGYDSSMLNHAIESGTCKGIIFEGTGLGHVGDTLYSSIQLAKEKGIFVGMTSQCIDGTINMSVYESGRDLLNLDVIPLGDMIPEVALVKFMWVLGNVQDLSEIKQQMTDNIASEINLRRN